jgi:hypothetical protein
MQVSLSEKILSRLSGSNSVNPVIEGDLLKLGRKHDVVQELNILDLSRKIIRCKITKGGSTSEFIYLSGQIVRPGELRLHNPSGGKKEIKERARHCRGCDKDLPRHAFAIHARKCMDCTTEIKKPPHKVSKEAKKETNVGTRICLICKVSHPRSAFLGQSRKCLATKDQHERYKAEKHSASQTRWRTKSKLEKENSTYVGTGRTSNRKGVILSAEIKEKMAASQRARYQHKAGGLKGSGENVSK